MQQHHLPTQLERRQAALRRRMIRETEEFLNRHIFTKSAKERRVPQKDTVRIRFLDRSALLRVGS